MNYNYFFDKAIKSLHKEERYRDFLNLSRINNKFPYAYNPKTKTNFVIWCSNDYLGQGQNPELLNSLINTAKKYGVGSGGTRNISGNHESITSLEKKIAQLYQKEQSLVFSSGFIANEHTISTISRLLPNCIIFSDQYNHASIIEGIRKYKTQKEIFKHNNLEDLEKKLSKYPIEQCKIIIFESIYSMNGSIAPIKEISKLAKKYNALTYLDEVHAVGLYGKNGTGFAEDQNISKEIDIIQGTFGKALGLIGGFIVANKNIIDSVRSYAAGFIFTTSLPPYITATIEKSIEYIINNPQIRTEFFKNVQKLKKLFKENNIPTIENQSHIIPVMIGHSKKCKEISNQLLNDYDIYLTPINYPTVEKGTERFRIIITNLHTDEMINKLVQALVILLKEHKII